MADSGRVGRAAESRRVWGRAASEEATVGGFVASNVEGLVANRRDDVGRDDGVGVTVFDLALLVAFESELLVAPIAFLMALMCLAARTRLPVAPAFFRMVEVFEVVALEFAFFREVEGVRVFEVFALRSAKVLTTFSSSFSRPAMAFGATGICNTDPSSSYAVTQL